MGSKSKTRFVIEVGGEPFELFSVRDRKKGDLLITIKPTDEADWGADHGKVVEQRISVHPASEGAAIGIKMTIGLDTSTSGDSYAHIIPNGSEVIWPIFSMAWPSILNASRILAHREGDTIVSIGKHTTLNSSLVYIAIVTSPGVDIDFELSAIGMIFHKARFRLFSIYVVHGFMYLPPAVWAAVCLVMTSSARSNKVPMSEIERIENRVGLRRDELRSTLMLIAEQLNNTMFSQIIKWMSRDGPVDAETMQIVGDATRMLYREPLTEE